MTSLSDDVVTEIILRLPVKSVARSTCVSKAWHATIADDYVRRRLPPHMSLIYFPDDGSKGPLFACAAAEGGGGGRLDDCDLGFFPFLEGCVPCDASNGLLLLRSVGTPRFFVVDPVARRWAELPPPSRDAMLSVLAFDPFAGSSSSRSFPWYRVINFTGWRGRVGEVEVFSSETREWVTRDADFGVQAGSLSGTMHFHAGAVYVLAFEPDCIVRMDMLDCAAADLTCTTIPLPEPTDGDGPVTHSRGVLHYVTSDRDRFNVWALDESSPTNQWTMKHVVRVDDVLVEAELEEGCRSRAGEIRFLAMHPDRDAAYLWFPWKIVEYDMARKEVTGAWEFRDDDKDHHKARKNRVFKTWLVPSSFYLSSDFLSADDGR